MRYRPIIRPLQLFLLASLTVALPLYGQDVFLGDTTSALARQAGKSELLAQVTKGKATPKRPATRPKPAPRPGPKPPPRSVPPPPARSFSVPVNEIDDDWTFSSMFSTSRSSESRHQMGAQGLVNYFGMGFGLEYHQDLWRWADWGAQVSSTTAALKPSKKSDTQEFINTSLSNVKGSLRMFRERTFYAGTALSLGMLSGQYGWRGPGIASGEIGTRFEAQLLTAEVFLGSEWGLPWGFYVGCDWVGFGLPLFGSLKVQDAAGLDITTTVLSGSDAKGRIRKEIAAQLKLYYLQARIGWSF